MSVVFGTWEGFRMAWIESHTHTVRHRKVANLARELRCRRSHAMGYLHALWHVVLEQQEDGDLTAWTDEFIAESSDFPNDAPQYVRLLQSNGFLDGRIVHDWLDYAGSYLISKYGGGGNTNGRAKLVAIWKKHGHEYGDCAKFGSKGAPKDAGGSRKSASEKAIEKMMQA